MFLYTAIQTIVYTVRVITLLLLKTTYYSQFADALRTEVDTTVTVTFCGPLTLVWVCPKGCGVTNRNFIVITMTYFPFILFVFLFIFQIKNVCDWNLLCFSAV